MIITLTDGGIETRIIYEFNSALRAMRAARSDLVSRVRGLKANASPLSPEELDKLDHVAATGCQTWARDEIACAREFDLTILGGCCGTDQHHIEALAQRGLLTHP
jgi:methionine synthase I (cobalamin-dependent)